MQTGVKKIAIIGANKEGLRLLPILLNDRKSRICVIADSNRDAMLFKLNELGYKLDDGLGIKVTNDLNEIRNIQGLDTVVNALQDPATERFLESAEFKSVEKLGPLSTRLIWGVRASTASEGEIPSKTIEQTTLLTSLREIVDAVRLTIDRKELLSVILKLATESTSAERGSIMLVSRDENALRVEIAKGMDEEVVRKIRVPMGEGISGKVAASGKSLLISGKATGGDFSRPMDRSDVKNAMCVPLVVSGEIIGVINVSSSESAHIFTNEDLNFLSSLASLAAEVIHRSNEYEKMRVDSAKFTFWKEVDSVMSSSAPLEARLTSVAKKLVDLVPGLTCFIYIHDEDRNRLFLKASSIRDSKGLGLVSLRPGEGIEGACVESMKDVVLVDRAPDSPVKKVYMTLPMVARNAVVGVMNCQIVSSHGLSIYHESFLRDIRTLLAESVYKHRKSESEKLKSSKMFAVDEAGLELISIKDPKRLMTIVTTTPAAILGAEGSLLRLKQSGSKRYQTAATYGLDDKNVREYFLPIEKETVMEVLRKKDGVAREFSEEASPYIRSVIARPLIVDNDVVGVLTLFNKTGETTLYPYGFSRSDSEILARFYVYAEKALANIVEGRPQAPAAKAAEPQPAPLAMFEKRVEEELNRARRFDKSLVLATIRVAGLKEAFGKGRAEFEARLINFIRRRTRSFDIVIRLNEETFGLLFLDTDEKIIRILGAVSEVVAGEDAFRKAFVDGRADILYGYAAFPREGDSFGELFSKASKRIRLDITKAFEQEF